jgi:prophage tail gpP-like protein
MPTEPIRLVVGGVEYGQWYEFDIDSDMLVTADAFSVTARLPPESIRDAFREGSNVDVYIGDDRQMAGVIDDTTLSGAKSKASIGLIGRDKGAWLLDSDADHVKGKSWTIQTLADKLIKPAWGIKSVVTTNESNRAVLLGRRSKKKASSPNPFSATPRKSIKVDTGTKIARLFDRETKKLGITWWLTAQGELYFGKPNYNQDPSYAFEVGRNVMSWSVDRSTKERCSTLEVVAQGPGSASSAFAATKNVKFHGVAHDDDLVARGIVRREIISDCDVESNKQAQALADWEMGKRRLSALRISITVPNFRQDTRLYAIDTIATVSIPAAGIDGRYYVTARRFTEAKDKSRTALTLHEPGVFLP